MGLLQKVSVDSITNKIYFLFRNSKSVIFDPSAVLPPGSVLAHAGATAPQGFLLCDGTAVSRTTYGALFKAIGVAHGYGDNSTTFNIPDCRGIFVRGVDGAASRDADKAARTAANTGGNTGNLVGSRQVDATSKNSISRVSAQVTSLGMSQTNFLDPADGYHGHSLNQGNYGILRYSGVALYYWLVKPVTENIEHAATIDDLFANADLSHTHSVTPTAILQGTGAESRPINVYVNYIIKI